MSQRVEIERDHKGEFKRVYVGQRIESVKPLAVLQERLFSHLSNFTPYSLEGLHTTLVHFGKPRSLYQEVTLANPELDEATFMGEFSQLLLRVDALPKIRASIPGEKVRFFGHAHERIVGVQLFPVPILMELNRVYNEPLSQLLDACGVTDQAAFIEGSNNLMWYSRPGVYHPHISIGKTAADLNGFKMEGLSISLEPPCIFNARVSSLSNE